MPIVIRRAMALALFGAVAGAACLFAAVAIHPDVAFEMDRDLPRITIGFYEPERSGDDTYAWTAGRARILLTGLDRRQPWTCSVRWRSVRPPGVDPPAVQLAIDGTTLATMSATSGYQTIEAIAPARAASGLSIAVITTPTFTSGPADMRELGVQVDRVACQPTRPYAAFAPSAALVSAGIATALFGAAFGLAGLFTAGAVITTAILALAQTIPLALDATPYTKYGTDAAWLACWIALATIALTRAIELARRQPLSRSAQSVVLFSSGMLYLKLAALLHPSKLVIDAVFHAHRLDWVLAGRYYFTQPIRNTEFPYAIALYVFAEPWAALTSNHVALLRVIVSASEAIAGALLYWLIVKNWTDRFAGVVAVVLFGLVPLSYIVTGNANLTNAFGQSIALVAVVAATTWRLRGTDIVQLVGLSILTAVALLSHVSTFALLSTTLFVLACAYRWKGGSNLRWPARSTLLALAIAVAVSIVAYYGHFDQVTGMLERVRAHAVSQVQPGSPATSNTVEVPTSLPIRVAKGLSQSIADIGWPILVLALVGLWRSRGAAGDRLGLALVAWGVTYVVFFAVGTIGPVSTQFERYAIEFVSRLNYATTPAVVVLAGRGTSWAWRAGPVPRVAFMSLMVAAAVLGFHEWTNWIE